MTGGTGGGAHALRRYVGDVDRFLADVFGRAPLLHRADDAEGHGSSGPLPLTIDDVDELLTRRSLRAPAFRLVQEGRPLPRSSFTRSGRIGGVTVTDLPDVGRILEHVHGGATLVLQGLHRYWPAVTRLCRELEDTLSHPVQANAYLTPPGNRGLDVHHDTHDVLALQLEGRKHWVVHEPAVTAPLPSQRWSSDEHTPGALLIDTELTAGDCLYLPRGTPHAAETTDGVSLHLTIGIRTVTWHDVLQRALAHTADEATFRESLPPGFVDDPGALATETAARLEEAAAWLRKTEPAALLDEVVAGVRRQQLPRLEGQLRRLLDLDHIGDDTTVRRRPDVTVAVATTDDEERVQLDLVDRTVAFPAAVRDEVERLVSGAPLRVDALERLDPDSRLVLVRRLVREGVLEALPDAVSDRPRA